MRKLAQAKLKKKSKLSQLDICIEKIMLSLKRYSKTMLVKTSFNIAVRTGLLGIVKKSSWQYFYGFFDYCGYNGYYVYNGYYGDYSY
jgi:hypothetical protein